MRGLGAGDHPADGGDAGAEQPGDADDLARAHLQGHAGQAPAGESETRSVDVEHHALQLRLAPSRPRALLAGPGAGQRGRARPCASPDHRGDQVVLGELGGRRGQHQLAVAQHGDVLADLEDLFQVVGDVEDGHAAGGELPHALEQPPDGVALERGGGLVEQHAPGAAGQRPRDLDDLELLDGQVAAGRSGVDVEAPVAHDLARPRRAARAS